MIKKIELIELLNANEGVIAFLGVILTIIIAIIGFYINKNISKITQKQDVKKNSKGLQASGDIVYKSINFK